MKQKILSRIFTVVMYLYFIPMILFIPYFNWTYAKDNGFVKWIFFGEVVATGKGIAWPYFYFFYKPKGSSSEHFIKSIEYRNAANKVIEQSQPLSSIPDIDMEKYITLIKKAYEEAELVDIEKLNGIHPNLGNHFHDEYIQGLQLILSGYNKQQNSDFIKAHSLLDKWGVWYYANIENIREGRKIEVQ